MIRTDGPAAAAERRPDFRGRPGGCRERCRQFQGGPGDQTAGLNATELNAYGRERGLYPQQVGRWGRAFVGDGYGKDRRKGNPRLVVHRYCGISAAAALEDVVHQIKLLS